MHRAVEWLRTIIAFALCSFALMCIIDFDLVTDMTDVRSMSTEEKLYSAMMDEREVINLVAYGLSPEALSDAWSHTIYDNADLFFVADTYEYRTLGDIVLCAMPQYAVSGDELVLARVNYNIAMKRILDTVDPAWSDLEKVLYLHDYLCMHYAYDETLTRYTAYELLTEGTGVCQAYTLAYSALLNACGIDCSYVVSREMNHAWNVVTIDGEAYNVDVTYDDPTADRLGKASHHYFLCSDTDFADDHSFTLEEGYGQCVSVRFDSGSAWENCFTGFVPVGDDFYFIKKGSLYCWHDGKERHIDTIRATWYASASSYWEGNFSALWSDGTHVLYSKHDCIMAYDPVADSFDVVFRYHGAGDIYGFRLQDGHLLLQISTSPNAAGEVMDMGVIEI